MLKYTLILLYLSICITAFSQDSLSQEIEEVVIQEKRLQIRLSEVSRNMTVINRSDIASSSAQSVAELLQSIAGVDIRRRGIHDIQSDISIRGGTFDQSLVLINGINMSDAQTGHHLMNIPVNLDNIERIEILKGPAARIYGQNAFAGAINIVTRKSRERSIRFRTDYSQNVTGQIGIQADLPGDKVNHQLSYSKSFSEGYRHNTDYNLDNFLYSNEIDLGSNSLYIQAGHSERAFGANGFYANPSATEQFEKIGTSMLSARMVGKKDNWTYRPSLYWRRNQDEYIFVRHNPSIYRNLHIGNTYGMEINASYLNKWGVLGIGLDTRIDDLRSNNLGERKRVTTGLNAEQRLVLWNGNLDITPGIALYSYSDFGTKAFPGVDLGIDLGNGYRIFSNAGTTWRVPTYTDLYYSDPTNLGNPDLQPETAFTTELGLKYQGQHLDWQLSAFQRNSKNLIDWTKSRSEDPWFPSNIGNITIRGLEAGITLDLNSRGNHELPVISLMYTYLDGDAEVDAPISRYALELINHHITGTIRYQISKKIYHQWTVKYVDRLTLDSYTIVDTRIGYRLNDRLDLSIFANNFLDKAYTETNLVPMPGRWLGINLLFKG